jgi:pilus assembly protein CpaB
MRAILFVVLLLAAGGLGFVAWQSAQPRPTVAAPMAKVRVLVANAPLHPGTLLKDQDLREREFPAEEVPEGAVTAGDQIRSELRGAMLRRYLGPGELLSRDDVLRPRDRGFLAAVLRPGTRAVAIGVDARTGAAGLIFPGDLVDVILTQVFGETEAPAGRRVVAETVLAGVRVIAVDQLITQGAPVPAAQAGPSDQVARTVTLEVRPEQSERIAVAERLGKLVLALRPIEAPDPEDLNRATTTVFGSDVSPALSRNDTPASQRIRVIQGNTVSDVVFR